MGRGLRAFPANGIVYGYSDPVVILEDGVVPLKDMTDYTGETVCIGGVMDGVPVKVANSVSVLEFDDGYGGRDAYRLNRFAFQRLVVNGDRRHMERWEIYVWLLVGIEPQQVILTMEIIAGLAYWGWGWRG